MEGCGLESEVEYGAGRVEKSDDRKVESHKLDIHQNQKRMRNGIRFCVVCSLPRKITSSTSSVGNLHQTVGWGCEPGSTSLACALPGWKRYLLAHSLRAGLC